MTKQKNSKVISATAQAKLMEAQLKDRFRNTPSEAKISGDIPQSFSRVMDIEAIPGWGVEVKLHPTKEDPSTSRRISPAVTGMSLASAMQGSGSGGTRPAACAAQARARNTNAPERAPSLACA